MYMMLRVHILSKKVTYIKLKVIGCSPHPIHEYFKVTTLLLTLVIVIVVYFVKLRTPYSHLMGSGRAADGYHVQTY